MDDDPVGLHTLRVQNSLKYYLLLYLVSLIIEVKMAISEEQKQKIKEEEEFRAKIKDDLNQSQSKKAKNKKGIGCLTVIIIFIVIGVIGSAFSSNSPTKETRDDFKASVNFTGTQFVISNLDDLDCENARLQINDGSYSLDGYKLEAGSTYTVGALQFTKSDGTRFNPIQVKPKTFNIYCSQIGSTNALGGASWYGEFK